MYDQTEDTIVDSQVSLLSDYADEMAEMPTRAPIRYHEERASFRDVLHKASVTFGGTHEYA